MLRFQYHEVKGFVRTSKWSGSKVVIEAANHFHSKVHPLLYWAYGDKVSQEVMVVCHYTETKNWWERVIERELATVNGNHAIRNMPLLSRKHYPRLLSNSEDIDIQSDIVIIDPANQDGTLSGQSPSIDETIKAAVSRAREAVIIIIGQSCLLYPEISKKTHWTEMESALTAAHMYASSHNGCIRHVPDGLPGHPLAPHGSIPEALLVDGEVQAYAQLAEEGYGYYQLPVEPRGRGHDRRL
jgi:hypothetical protein